MSTQNANMPVLYKKMYIVYVKKWPMGIFFLRKTFGKYRDLHLLKRKVDDLMKIENSYLNF